MWVNQIKSKLESLKEIVNHIELHSDQRGLWVLKQHNGITFIWIKPINIRGRGRVYFLHFIPYVSQVKTVARATN